MKRNFIFIFLLILSCSHTLPPPPVNFSNKPVVIKEFFLGPGDELNVFVWRHPDLTLTTKVDPWGRIFYPLIGEIQLKKMTVLDLQKRIQKGLSKYLVNPQVTVSVKTYRNLKIMVLGEVKKPAVFPIDRPITITEAISLAGGFTLDAKQTSIIVIRGNNQNPTILRLNLKGALTKADFSQNIYLQPGDIVYIPPSIIANLERFFKRFESILRPFVDLSVGVLIWRRVEEW